ncbi:hypothetical protein EZJ43_12900 [Pedobacter changchengzhani]|uniref:Tetratricopeptide repeat protein n=1 Tax=Pedobacter changchengzhani TaxID=2529274 RepID=A0A4R5MJF3_9SPHI|nr:hypothetical protein [Pedobacter changchengzhani]TDG35516.1 hypothetical protein EZJ43_12900 [Pedobacter changchengzhani]
MQKIDYPGKYSFIKRVVLHKDDVGEVALNFLGKDSADEPKIDKYIQSVWGIIKFKADSLYKPTVMTDALVGKFYKMRPVQTAAQVQAATKKNERELSLSLVSAQEYLRDHQFKEALSNCNQVLKLYPTNQTAFLIGIEAQVGLGNLDEALLMGKKGVMALDQPYNKECGYADSLIQLGRPKEAIEIYIKILKEHGVKRS